VVSRLIDNNDPNSRAINKIEKYKVNSRRLTYYTNIDKTRKRSN